MAKTLSEKAMGMARRANRLAAMGHPSLVFVPEGFNPYQLLPLTHPLVALRMSKEWFEYLERQRDQQVANKGGRDFSDYNDCNHGCIVREDCSAIQLCRDSSSWSGLITILPGLEVASGSEFFVELPGYGPFPCWWQYSCFPHELDRPNGHRRVPPLPDCLLEIYRRKMPGRPMGPPGNQESASKKILL